MNKHVELIEKLKKIAMNNYNNGGDMMVECWDNDDYLQFIENHGSSAESVVNSFYEAMGVMQESRKGIESMKF
ncbi:hypothetical protein [Bacillus sp. NPDC094106]|uniref:hypothetical protein n=1 Tax=Bacillus sp. NPDC094106 TaxID=3363949 RepID=UPI00381842CD